MEEKAGSYPFTSDSHNNFLPCLSEIPQDFTMEDLLLGDSAGLTQQDPIPYTTTGTGPSIDEIFNDDMEDSFAGLTELDTYTDPASFDEIINDDDIADSFAGITNPYLFSAGDVSSSSTTAETDTSSVQVKAATTAATVDNLLQDLMKRPADAVLGPATPLEGNAAAGLYQPAPPTRFTRPVAATGTEILREQNSHRELRWVPVSVPGKRKGSPLSSNRLPLWEIKFYFDSIYSNHIPSSLYDPLGDNKSAEQDQAAPSAVRSYRTTKRVRPSKKTHHGYWKEKECKIVSDNRSSFLLPGPSSFAVVKRTFQFYRNNGIRTKWFIHEYVRAANWGIDMYLFDEAICYREVVNEDEEDAATLAELNADVHTPVGDNVKNETSSTKHRKREPGDPRVVQGESQVWHDFNKIYDKHPESPGSKVVYGVCCHCNRVLKADNGTNSLKEHCKTCPSLNHPDPSSSPFDPQVRGPCKSKRRLTLGSSSTRRGLGPKPGSNVAEESKASGLAQPHQDSGNIKPPTSGTDIVEITHLLRDREKSRRDGDEVNCSIAVQDQADPKAVRSYVTSMRMMPEHNTDQGYWKEKDRMVVSDVFPVLSSSPKVKRIFQFFRNDGKNTNWLTHEYIQTDYWGIDLFLLVKGLCFRDVFNTDNEEPGESTLRPVNNIKTKTARVKHQKREPDDLGVKARGSSVWKHFVKMYDKHPEHDDGSNVVYGVCCLCIRVLKVDKGTKSLRTHCGRTCPSLKVKDQKPSSS